MLKFLASEVWVYDAEWVPDPISGRRAYGLSDDLDDAEVVAIMYAKGGATLENPYPFLKTVLCRIVSIAALKRRKTENGLVLEVKSIPAFDGPMDLSEADIISKFLSGVGAAKPQLVGYNCKSADLPALLQRAIVNEVVSKKFCARPAKPWEGVDYFAKYSDHHIDLMEMLAGWGKGTPSLHEIATACRIPGKLDTTGDDVAELWATGQRKRIIGYNITDVLTQYELLMRVALFAGFVSPLEYAEERVTFDSLLGDLGATNPQIRAYAFERQQLNHV
jgi:3'-5' exonuclease